MCTDEQHSEKMSALKRIEKLLEISIKSRPVIDTHYMVSDTQGFFLDYKDRKHLFIYSTAAITLSLQVFGTLSVSQNVWTIIDYTEGLQVFTSGTATPVTVVVRASDQTVA